MPGQYDIQKLRQLNLFNPIPYMDNGMQDFSQMPDASIPPFAFDPNPDVSRYGQSIPTPESPRIDYNTGRPSTIDPRNPNRIWDMINKVYTPETQSRDRLNNLLDTYPDRQEPSLARRFVAAGMGFGQKDPLATMENVMYAPHKRDVADWSTKAGPFQQAYTTENAANVNERTLAGNAVTAQANMERYDQQAKIAEDKNEIARIVALARQAQASNWKVQVMGTQIVATGPGGEMKVLGNVAGKLSDTDKANIEGGWDLKTAEAGANSRERVATINAPLIRIGNQLYRDTPDGLKEVTPPGLKDPNTISGATEVGPPKATSTGHQTSAEIQAERQRRMQYAYDNIEGGKEFIKYHNGVYSLIDRPKSTLFGVSVESKQKYVDSYDTFVKWLNEGLAVPAGMDKAPAATTPRPEPRIVDPNKGLGSSGQPMGGFGAAPPPSSVTPKVGDRVVAGTPMPSASDITGNNRLVTDPQSGRKYQVAGGEVLVRSKTDGKVFNMTSQQFALAQARRPGQFELVGQ